MRTTPRHTTTEANPQAAPAPATTTPDTPTTTITTTTPTTTTTTTEHDVPAAGPRIGFGTAIAVAAALATVVVAIVVAIAPTVTPPGEEAPTQLEGEAAALERLVRLGYVPGEALEPAITEDVLTRRLQATGQVPTGPTTVPAPGPVAQERVALRALVNRGLVPAETLQPTTEDGHLDHLILRGLVPEGP